MHASCLGASEALRRGVLLLQLQSLARSSARPRGALAALPCAALAACPRPACICNWLAPSQHGPGALGRPKARLCTRPRRDKCRTGPPAALPGLHVRGGVGPRRGPARGGGGLDARPGAAEVRGVLRKRASRRRAAGRIRTRLHHTHRLPCCSAVRTSTRQLHPRARQVSRSGGGGSSSGSCCHLPGAPRAKLPTHAQPTTCLLLAGAC